MSSFRLLFALATMKDYFVIKFNVKTVFLCGEIHKDLFLKIPEGLEEAAKMCKLRKNFTDLNKLGELQQCYRKEGSQKK